MVVEMREVILITYKNDIFRDELSNKGYRVKDLGQTISEEKISKLENNSYGSYAIVEIFGENMDGLIDLIKEISKVTTRVICIVGELTEKMRSYLIEYGIADVITSYDVKRVVNYIDTIDRNVYPSYGKILILDDLIPRINILKTIVSRFQYIPIVTKTIDEFFEYFDGSNIQLMLLNLGTEDFDINGFIKRSYGRTDIKKIPVIPYKNTIEEFFIHEIISGLNRLANVILSSDELYSFLIDILFRRELFPFIGMLKESVGYDNLIQFSRESLHSIYFSLGDDIFSMENILKEERLTNINDIMDSIMETIIKVDGLRWLIKEEKTKTLTGVHV